MDRELKALVNFDRVFLFMVITFIISFCIVACYREGKDLKVGLFGVERVLQKKSPYQNPTDINRPIYRYAPGFAILQYPFLLNSKLVDERVSYVFKDITPSIFTWYLAQILGLAASMLILLKLIPAKTREAGARNIKISFLLAMPLIAYELANCQNKLMALFFILLAIYLFEKNRHFPASLAFAIAITIYIPLVIFILYFLLRSKGRFILSFAAGIGVVFFIVPSLIYGFKFNNFLLWDWYTRCLKPFFFANSYASYIDLRLTSQSLPSAVGRLFVSGLTDNFKYMLSPSTIHIIIKAASGVIVFLSCLSILGIKKDIHKGLAYGIFLALALILPSYCLIYTWSWLFVIYFALLNYAAHPEVSLKRRGYLFAVMSVLVISSYSASMAFFNRFSILFWGTILFWFSATFMLIKKIDAHD